MAIKSDQGKIDYAGSFGLLSCGTPPAQSNACLDFPRLAFSVPALMAMDRGDLDQVRKFNDKWDVECGGRPSKIVPSALDAVKALRLIVVSRPPWR